MPPPHPAVRSRSPESPPFYLRNVDNAPRDTSHRPRPESCWYPDILVEAPEHSGFESVSSNAFDEAKQLRAQPRPNYQGAISSSHEALIPSHSKQDEHPPPNLTINRPTTSASHDTVARTANGQPDLQSDELLQQPRPQDIDADLEQSPHLTDGNRFQRGPAWTPAHAGHSDSQHSGSSGSGGGGSSGEDGDGRRLGRRFLRGHFRAITSQDQHP
jgi:hypothetical protein